jgi:ketosteroid isomerase-like protein
VTDAVEGDRGVAVRLQRRLQGKSSGVEVDYDYWAVFTFRDGNLSRAEWFDARSDALEAAGHAK